MNTKQKTIVILVLGMSMLMSACGPGQLLGPTVTPTPTHTLSPTNTPTPIGGGSGRIAYTSLDFEISTMNIDGSNVTNLTNDPALDFAPAWSPDGKQIAFYSSRNDPHPSDCMMTGCQYDIYVMKADGSNLTRLTDNLSSDTAPAWSPDGTRIAFKSNRGSNYEIYVMNADGSNVVRLTDNPAGESSPAWSSDGTRIVFVSDRDGNDEIYTMNADGSNVVRLTDNPAGESSPAWSPDGTRIVFVSDRYAPRAYRDIFIMDATGQNVIRLTDVPNVDNLVASWTPDGRRIIFAIFGGTLCLIDTDGSNRTCDNSISVYSPTWQPK